MIVKYDYQIFCNQQYGGISRYFCEIIKQLENSHNSTADLTVFFSNNDQLKRLPLHNKLPIDIDFKGKKDTVKFINKLYANNIQEKRPFDLFHPTYYDINCLKNRKSKPMVITIHDLIDEKFHQNDKKYSSLINNRKVMIEEADTIISVSENTKKDLIELFNVPAEKIKVIYHGNSITEIIPRKSLSPIVNEDYILYVGKRNGYKNFNAFINASLNILHKNKGIKIVCAGGANFSDNEIEFFKKANIISQLIYKPILDDTDLENLYNNALLFIYPSLYEGFGFPIIEAFNCSCPIAATNASCIPEVAGNAVVYFNPIDENSISQALEKVFNNTALQEELIQKGHKQSKQFTWEKAGNQTFDVYKSLIS